MTDASSLQVKKMAKQIRPRIKDLKQSCQGRIVFEKLTIAFPSEFVDLSKNSKNKCKGKP